MEKLVYLIGFRGAGKTSLGKKLAESGGRDFLDLDDVWEKQAGQTILEFVEKNGLEAFRREEEGLLRQVDRGSPAKPLLVATGGGIVSWEPSFEVLRASKFPKIFLRVASKDLWERLSRHPERRKIGDLSDFSRLESLLADREPRLEKIATYTVENRDITQALSEVETLLGRLWQDAP
jgi:shikimate kinase